MELRRDGAQRGCPPDPERARGRQPESLEELSQRTIPLQDHDEERVLFGNLDHNLHLLRKLFDVDAVSRGGVLKLSGDPANLEEAGRVVERILDLHRRGQELQGEDVERLLRGAVGVHVGEPGGGPRPLRMLVDPRTENQARYIRAILDSTVTFAIGPAGSGKSFLAVAMAVSYLKCGAYRRIVLCRPAVEAGESLGFLPGDLAAKINPYLRPLYDALHDLLPHSQLKRYMDEGVVEILPLAYMRGRTLDHAVVILDEAQNCTVGQMKMALTRLGCASKMIVTGDITQVDLPRPDQSGLLGARRILTGIEGVAFIHLGKSDIVRHPVVAEIVRAYSRAEEGDRLRSREIHPDAARTGSAVERDEPPSPEAGDARERVRGRRGEVRPPPGRRG